MITLNGAVVASDYRETEELEIRPGETDAYERKGYSVMDVADLTLAFRDLPTEDGTIAIAPKSDAAGRSARAGRHADRGYSGYFVGYVYQGGMRRGIIDWISWFPNSENRYATQADKGGANSAVERIVESFAGRLLVKGGYERQKHEP